jgi:hypothetical protein
MLPFLRLPILLGCLAAAAPVAAQEDAEDGGIEEAAKVEQAQPVRRALRAFKFGRITTVQMDRWIFGPSTPEAARQRLVANVEQHIREIDRLCRIDAEQSRKLRLAVALDVKRLFHGIDAFRRKWSELDSEHGVPPNSWRS